jgi:hypothetical protein
MVLDAFSAALADPAEPAAADVAATPEVVPTEPVIVTPAAPEVLEAAIEAAHPEHPIAGPAEPPETVPALGEMPAEPQPEPARAEAPAVIAVPAPEAPAPKPRPSAPASTPGAAFNPEIVPAED